MKQLCGQDSTAFPGELLTRRGLTFGGSACSGQAGTHYSIHGVGITFVGNFYVQSVADLEKCRLGRRSILGNALDLIVYCVSCFQPPRANRFHQGRMVAFGLVSIGGRKFRER
jgi:hypothetical protein